MTFSDLDVFEWRSNRGVLSQHVSHGSEMFYEVTSEGQKNVAKCLREAFQLVKSYGSLS